MSASPRATSGSWPVGGAATQDTTAQDTTAQDTGSGGCSRVQNFVGGEWLDAVDGAVMPVTNPATGQVTAQAPRGARADVDRAVAAATRALPGWLETTPKERADMLLKLADAVDEHAAELMAAESANVGKPRSADEPEIPFTADNLRFFAGAARIPDGMGRALGLARQLQFGTVWINDHLPPISEMPWTGMKQSGYGRDMARYALEDYSQLKHVMAKLG